MFLSIVYWLALIVALVCYFIPAPTPPTIANRLFGAMLAILFVLIGIRSFPVSMH